MADLPSSPVQALVCRRSLSARKSTSRVYTEVWLGINLAFAKLLVENGCNVLIADLALRPEAQVLVEKHSSGPRAVFQETDVRDWIQLERMFEVAEREFGEIDVVCPGAGVYEPVGSRSPSIIELRITNRYYTNSTGATFGARPARHRAKTRSLMAGMPWLIST